MQDWDTQIVSEWYETDNEYAVITTYPTEASHSTHTYLCTRILALLALALTSSHALITQKKRISTENEFYSQF